MAKIQKVWLAVSGALFLVPEILWSPLLNFWYEFFQLGKGVNAYPIRNNFLTNIENVNILIIIFAIQAAGLLGLLFWFLFGKAHKAAKIIGLIFSFLCLLAVGCALVLLYSFSSWR
jgi:magnesium-transporting ATPase (P-type)